MHVAIRRCVVAAVASSCLTFAGAATASAQSLPLSNYAVSGSLTLAKLRQTAKFPSGSTFNGSLNVTTGVLTGNVTIPTLTASLTVLGIPMNTKLQFTEVKAVTATVTGLGSSKVTITGSGSEDIKLVSLSSPRLFGVNLVGNNCHTSAPVVLPLNYSGPLNLSSPFTVSGSVTIPRFAGCGFATPLLDFLMSGSGNAFTVTLTPPPSSGGGSSGGSSSGGSSSGGGSPGGGIT
jgi:hypothetical protein